MGCQAWRNSPWLSSRLAPASKTWAVDALSPGGRVTHRPSTDAWDDEQEGGSERQEDNNHYDGADIEHKVLPLLQVEGVDAVEESHCAPPGARGREAVTAEAQTASFAS